MASAPDDNPFWRFSLAVYASPGVPAECLALQERLGLDVNVLLFCCYAGAVNGARLSADHVADLRGAVSGWHQDVVRVLRSARQTLKNPPVPAGSMAQDIQSLRNTVKSVELEAERIEQHLLWQWLSSHGGLPTIADVRGAAASNVSMLLKSYGDTGAPPDLVIDTAVAVAARVRSI